jgi:hypothetical protein
MPADDPIPEVDPLTAHLLGTAGACDPWAREAELHGT